MFKKISLFLVSSFLVLSTIGSAYAVNLKLVTNGQVLQELMVHMMYDMKWYK